MYFSRYTYTSNYNLYSTGGGEHLRYHGSTIFFTAKLFQKNQIRTVVVKYMLPIAMINER